MKIAIIGFSGAGKSTLAKQLGEKHCCPVLYMDTINFEAGWKERDRDTCKWMVSEFIKKDAWVIDGNYEQLLLEQRLWMANQIVFLNFPRRLCLFQAFRRYLSHRNQVRESMSAGCEEKFDLAFIKWILLDGRTEKYQQRYQRICEIYHEKVIVCRNRKEVRDYFAERSSL